jgi:hypothetical protein
LADELSDLPRIPLQQFPAVACTNQLLVQYHQAKIPFNCGIGDLLPAEQVLTIGNFSAMGLTRSSLWQIANVNNIDLSAIGVDRLQDFYALITPNKLLSDRFGGFYHQQTLSELPLVTEALLQKIANKIQLNEITDLKPLNDLIQQANGYTRGVTNWFSNGQWLTEQFRQKLAALSLNDLVTALPDFGNFSVANVPIDILQSMTVSQALPALVNQSIGNIAGVESLLVGDLGAIGLPNLSMSQMPNPIALATGINFGRFDFPLSNDEKNPERQLAGGVPNSDYQLRKQNCSDKCKYAEIAAPGTAYHGAAWVDGNEHWVQDGFGLVCWAWPGGCKGPAGNHPFGHSVRLLLTNIESSTGTAQVSLTFPICWDVMFVGTTCTPAIFPVASGIPLYTIREGSWLPFVVPVNYSDQTNSSLPPTSPDRPIPKLVALHSQL